MTRGWILAAFSLGYLMTQILGGRLAEQHGFKKVYGFALLFTAILAFLSPLVVKLNVWAFFLLRVIQGMFEGVCWPALQVMLVRWVPHEERNSFMARSFFGTLVGVVITFPLCANLSQNHGWDWGFYVTGGLTCIWFVAWWFLVFDSPQSHPRLDSEQKNHILESISKHYGVQTGRSSARKTPWKSIFTSVPLWGAIISACGNDWGFATLGTNGPMYLKYMIGVDLAMLGCLSASDYIL